MMRMQHHAQNQHRACSFIFVEKKAPAFIDYLILYEYEYHVFLLWQKNLNCLKRINKHLKPENMQIHNLFVCNKLILQIFSFSTISMTFLQIWMDIYMKEEEEAKKERMKPA